MEELDDENVINVMLKKKTVEDWIEYKFDYEKNGRILKIFKVPFGDFTCRLSMLSGMKLEFDFGKYLYNKRLLEIRVSKLV